MVNFVKEYNYKQIEIKRSKDEYEIGDSIDELNRDDLLKYIRFMKKVKLLDREVLIKCIVCYFYKMICVESVDMKGRVNNFYKNVKRYKDHYRAFRRNKRIIIESFVSIFEENKEEQLDILRYILHILYNEHILNDKSIIEWYKECNNKCIKENKLLCDFVGWIDHVDDEECENSESGESGNE